MSTKTISFIVCLTILILNVKATAQDAALWYRSMSAGKEAESKGGFDEAEGFYRNALSEGARFGEANEYIALALLRLAFTYHSQWQIHRQESPQLAQAKLVEAEQTFRQLLRVQETRFGPQSQAVAIVLSELARLNVTLNRQDEAEKQLLRALDIIRRPHNLVPTITTLGYESTVDQLATIYCQQKRYADARTIDTRLVPNCIEDKQRKDWFQVNFLSVTPQKRVNNWLKHGTWWGEYGDTGQWMNIWLVANGLDAVPYLTELVYHGKGDNRLAALSMLCRMDKFVPLAQLPKGVSADNWHLTSWLDTAVPAGRTNSLLVVNGQRIGKEGFAAVSWAAEQTKHNDLRFHARQWSGLFEQDLRSLPLKEQLTRWRKASAACRSYPGMNDDCTIRDHLEPLLSESVPDIIPIITDVLEHDSNPYVREDALGLLEYIDARSVRLRGLAEGQKAITAIRRALEKCRMEPFFDETENCQDEWQQLSRQFFDDEISSGDYWLGALQSTYGIKLSSPGRASSWTPEARRFTAYLTQLDPYFPSWEFVSHVSWEEASFHPRSEAKRARYYEQWQRFQSASSTK